MGTAGHWEPTENPVSTCADRLTRRCLFAKSKIFQPVTEVLRNYNKRLMEIEKWWVKKSSQSPPLPLAGH